MPIYKIFRAAEWAQMQAEGETAGAPVDLADGFVHFSTAAQVRETATRHFRGEDNLTLVAAAPERMGDALVWEPSRGGALFPHLYGRFSMAHVLWAKPLPLGPDGHQFPEDLEADAR